MFAVVRRNPQFARLWLAQVVSQAGDWLNRMAVLALIGQLSDRTAQVGMGLLFGGELALRLMPAAVFGPLAGPVADRLPRKVLMVAADLLRGVIVLGFLLVDREDELGLLYGLLLCQMSLGIFFDSARAATLPNTVPREELHEAYTLSAATWSTMLALGAFVGGVVLKFFGLAAVFVLDAATYIVSAALLASLRVPPTPSHPEPFRWRDVLLLVELRRALDHVRSLGLLPVLVAKTFWGMAGGFLVLLAVLGNERFASGEQDAARDLTEVGSVGLATSLLFAARGVGTGLGPILARRLFGSSDRALRRNIGAGFIVAGCFYAMVPFAGSLAVAWVLIVAAHMGGSTLWVSSTTYWQRRVSDSFRGRVFSLDFLGMTMSFTLWGVMIGGVFDHTGSLRWALWLASGSALVAGAVWLILARRLRVEE